MVRSRDPVTASLFFVLTAQGVSAQERSAPRDRHGCDSLCITPTRTIAFETSQGT
jgi:hypothetical protein